MKLISDTDTLQRLTGRLAAAPYVAVDTEFLRERTYWAQLCLVQVAHGDEAAAIDPLARGIDLSPLWELLADPRVVKVFHSASQDMEVLLRETGAVPTPVFDTQIAAMVAGYGDQVGYAALASEIAGATLDKASQRTDWSRRPLTDRQIAYAISDVTHLCTIYETLERQLTTSGRSEWVRTEMDRLAEPSLYRTEPDEAYRRLKVRRPSRRTLQVLRAVAAWRERTAQQRDKPRPWILKDDAVIEIATHAPGSAGELERVRGLRRETAHGRDGRALLEAVREALAVPESEWPEVPPRKRPLRANDDLVALLQALLKLRCKEHDVAPKLVATRAELDRISATDEPDLRPLTGWRREIFGADALALKAGRLALTVDGDQVRVVRLEDSAPPAAPREAGL